MFSQEPWLGGGGVGGQPGTDGRLAQLVLHSPGVDRGDDGRVHRVGDEPGFDPAFGGFDRVGVGVAFAVVADGDGADVPAVEGVFFQPVPDLAFQLEPVPSGHALLDPADENHGGVDAFDVEGLVGGEQRDALVG